jgi:hypothetical protein
LTPITRRGAPNGGGLFYGSLIVVPSQKTEILNLAAELECHLQFFASGPIFPELAERSLLGQTKNHTGKR